MSVEISVSSAAKLGSFENQTTNKHNYFSLFKKQNQNNRHLNILHELAKQNQIKVDRSQTLKLFFQQRSFTNWTTLKKCFPNPLFLRSWNSFYAHYSRWNSWPPRGGWVSLHHHYYYYQDGVCVSGSIVRSNNTKTCSRNVVFSSSSYS